MVRVVEAGDRCALTTLNYTLVADGPTDRALLPIINWVLEQIPMVSASGFVAQFADPHILDDAAAGLEGRIVAALQRFPCDIAFVHRDAESEGFEKRRAEIGRAIEHIANGEFVPVVPVRMTEAWLLTDESPIRQAADNPNGTAPLALPPVRQLEQLPDPKSFLNDLLIVASEKAGRRQAKFKRPSELAWRRVRVAQLTKDFSPLRSLGAFAEFERATRAVFPDAQC